MIGNQFLFLENQVSFFNKKEKGVGTIGTSYTLETPLAKVGDPIAT